MEPLFNDGIMEATAYPEGWLFLRWVQNTRGRLQRKLLLDLVATEHYILDNGLKGWFTSSELEHKDFQMLLHRIGASFMAKDPSYVYMKKWITQAGDVYKIKKRGIHVREPAISTPATPIS